MRGMKVRTYRVIPKKNQNGVFLYGRCTEQENCQMGRSKPV